jgi:hypothetical protein
MARFTAPVEDHLVLQADVRLPPAHERYLVAVGQRVPAPVPVRLVIDTGSKRTCLIPGIFERLRPTSGAIAHVITSLGSTLTDLAWVCLEFPGAGLASFREVLVARLAMPPALSHFHGLLGRDLLARLESFECSSTFPPISGTSCPGRWLMPWTSIGCKSVAGGKRTARLLGGTEVGFALPPATRHAGSARLAPPPAVGHFRFAWAFFNNSATSAGALLVVQSAPVRPLQGRNLVGLPIPGRRCACPGLCC